MIGIPVYYWFVGYGLYGVPGIAVFEAAWYVAVGGAFA